MNRADRVRRGVLMVAGLVVGVTACGGADFTSDTVRPQPTMPGPGSTVATTPPTTGAGPTAPTAPASTPASTVTPPAPGTNSAWFVGEGCGATLLDPAGHWWGFRAGSGPLADDEVRDVVVDDTGVAWLALGYAGIVRVDGGAWSSISLPSLPDGSVIGTVTELALAADGAIWALGDRGIARYASGSWTTHPASDLGISFGLLGLTVAADGHAWVVTDDLVARLDDPGWTTWRVGTDLGVSGTDEIRLTDVAATPDGAIWVVGEQVTDPVLFTFDGTTWAPQTAPDVGQPQQLTATADGRVWITTWADGLAVRSSGGGWHVFTRADDGLPSDRVRAVAVDEAGRVWVGTTWGLAVLDGNSWSVYSMATSGLAGNCVDDIAVGAQGPPLPPPGPERVGTLTGVLDKDGAPLVGSQIVLCSEDPAMFFTSGGHPCSGQAVSVLTTTDEAGRFVFRDVPVGEGYDFAWQDSSGWRMYFIGGPHFTVTEGTTDVGVVDVSG